MSDKLGFSNARDVVMMTENDRYKLSDLRGWSEKLVDNMIYSANKLVKNND